MIWVKLFPAETVEQLAYRLASILAYDGLDSPPPYAKGNGRWQLDRGNNWTCGADDAPGWAQAAHRYGVKEARDAVAQVLRVLDGRTVSVTEPQQQADRLPEDDGEVSHG